MQLVNTPIELEGGSVQTGPGARSAFLSFLAMVDVRVATDQGFVHRPNVPRSAVTGARESVESRDARANQSDSTRRVGYASFRRTTASVTRAFATRTG